MNLGYQHYDAYICVFTSVLLFNVSQLLYVDKYSRTEEGNLR